MKYLSYVLFTLLIIPFINDNKAHPLDLFTVVTVDDYNPNNGLYFYYHDSLAYGRPVIIADVETKILLNAPTLLFNNKQIPFLIYPGEQINIKYAATDSLLLYVKGNEERTNELNFFRKLVQRTGSVYGVFDLQPYHQKAADLRVFYKQQKTINEVKNVRLEFLKSYGAKYPVSGRFSAIAVNSINSTALTDSLILAFSNKALLGKDLYEKLIKQKLLTLKSIGYEPYLIYQEACLKLLSMATAYNYEFDDKLNGIKKFETILDFAIKNFEGKTKDFLITKAMFSAYDANLMISKEALIRYNEQCIDEQFKKMIEQKIVQNKQRSLVKTKDNLLGVDRKTIITMQETISKHKGKLIILDFWASWCVPCRAETPYLASLKKYYQNKNVVFISISTDKDINNWIRAGKEDSLIDNNFLLLESDKSPFKTIYKINALPHYLLIGKDGKMLDDNVPRPSNPDLKNTINKFI